jgi:hypothetical protein
LVKLLDLAWHQVKQQNPAAARRNNKRRPLRVSDDKAHRQRHLVFILLLWVVVAIVLCFLLRMVVVRVDDQLFNGSLSARSPFPRSSSSPGAYVELPALTVVRLGVLLEDPEPAISRRDSLNSINAYIINRTHEAVGLRVDREGDKRRRAEHARLKEAAALLQIPNFERPVLGRRADQMRVPQMKARRRHLVNITNDCSLSKYLAAVALKAGESDILGRPCSLTKELEPPADAQSEDEACTIVGRALGFRVETPHELLSGHKVMALGGDEADAGARASGDAHALVLMQRESR